MAIGSPHDGMTQDTHEPTPEQMIVAVIEAQVKGGCTKFEKYITARWNPDEDEDRESCPLFYRINHTGKAMTDVNGFHYDSILEILLDPAGLRAAYGDHGVCSGCLNKIAKKCHCEIYGGNAPDIEGIDYVVAHRILDTWLSEPDGDAIGAIRTAYFLLRK